VTVVGGGAGSVEIMLALIARARGAGQNVNATLVCGSDELTEDLGPRFASRARGVLESRGVKVLTGQRVTTVAADHVVLADGTRIDSALTVWVTGPAAPVLLRKSGLPVDEDGYLRVDATLRAVNGDAVFGSGDCVTLVESPWAAKSLVHARGAAPVLANNLRNVLRGPAGEPKLYDAPQHALSILDTSDGKALLYWQGWTVYTKWAMTLKRWLDSRRMQRYRVL
jgi:selenide,water dikinase